MQKWVCRLHLLICSHNIHVHSPAKPLLARRERFASIFYIPKYICLNRYGPTINHLWSTINNVWSTINHLFRILDKFGQLIIIFSESQCWKWLFQTKTAANYVVFFQITASLVLGYWCVRKKKEVSERRVKINIDNKGKGGGWCLTIDVPTSYTASNRGTPCLYNAWMSLLV